MQVTVGLFDHMVLQRDARGVARAHGGGIDVSSVPGVGTEFIITLPLVALP